VAQILAGVAIVAVSLGTGCDAFKQESDIQTVKRATISTPGGQESVAVGPSVASLAGVTGTVLWKSFRPDKYRENRAVVVVQADIQGPCKATIQFLLNRDTGAFELAYYAVNGEERSLFEGFLAMQSKVLLCSLRSSGREKEHGAPLNDRTPAIRYLVAGELEPSPLAKLCKELREVSLGPNSLEVKSRVCYWSARSEQVDRIFRRVAGSHYQDVNDDMAVESPAFGVAIKGIGRRVVFQGSYPHDGGAKVFFLLDFEQDTGDILWDRNSGVVDYIGPRATELKNLNAWELLSRLREGPARAITGAASEGTWLR